ncbi:small conductance mechanosensitive channel [Vreelandella aquamarina]|uniref:Small conductance mechanosensitive channel n=1 Tax=Vreelandella aquamarina TaxID=77097 RepID=A0A1N6DSJ5_9GAMM|nr:small conductance mechanosensitive channel [Halomonas aquamarina]SIN64232.1 small conductance mechanosensitive channel [Halomonas meridiana]SIN73762.1 small conductance mechanosensitive channel [Halomonas meridiana]SIO40416.1 small conductance mechanosensitive channel [Halomonas meridiana]
MANTHPKGGYGVTSLRLLPWLSVWMLALFAMLAGPAMAQTTLSAESDASVAEEQPSYAALADLLEDEQARQELIELLRNQASELPAGVAAELSPEAAAAGGNVAPEDVSLPRQLAELTSRVVGDVGGQIEQAVAIVGNIFTGQGAGSSFDMAAFMNAAINLGIVIVATFAIFMVFRRLAKSLFTKISGWSQQGTGLTPVLRLVLCVAVAAVVDILLIALAYVGGNLVATFAVGETGELSTRASLFLNAFLIIELLKAGVRMLFSSRYEGLRLLPISAQEASYWNRWLARLIGMVGYGLMVVVPLVNFYVAATLGQAVGTLIMLLAFIYAVGVVLKNRVRLRDNLNKMSARSTLTASRVSLQLFARTWHLFALIYFLMVFVLTLTRPGDALPFVLFATLKTLGAVVVGLLLSTFLTQTIGRRIQLSDDLRRKLPLLEVRLNSYVPNALRVLRTVIVVAVIMVVLDAWGAFNLAAWYASERGANLVGNLISVAVILIVSLGIWLGLASLIEHKLNPETGHGEPSARAKTLLSLFRNALAIAMVTITGMIVLSEIGINIGPLIAGAGVLGLAIGFGAQRLVQDVITGVFIQVENAMNTGDVVTVGGITGTAERLSIRSVGIRDLSGTYHIVPFSSVDTVSNYMREYGNHVGEYGIAYRENIDDAIAQLQLAFEDLKASDEHGHQLLADMTVAGVTALADSSVNIRVVIKTTPGDQWGVGRAYNRLVKMRFDSAGIEIPFPHTTLYFGQDKSGSAPPANLRVMQQDFTIDGSPAGQPKRAELEVDDRHRPRRGKSPSAQEAEHHKPDDEDV